MQFDRTKLLIGEEKLNILQNSSVAVFGIGGVGSYVCESLVRSGIGTITIIDFDKVDITNLNRQIIALNSTIGKSKVSVMKNRLLDINPNLIINTYECFVSKETINDFDFSKYDYVVDAIDNVTGKLLIIENCLKNNTKIISSLGTANKLDPTKLVLTDISKTHTCPLAKVMRLELRKREINHLDVLFSTELPTKNDSNILGSMSYLPSIGGLLISSKVILNLINEKK